MKRLVLFAAVALAIANGINVAAAAELPTYESAGFPITAHQFSVMGASHVQEAPGPRPDAGWNACLAQSDPDLDGAQAVFREQAAKLTARAQTKSQSAMVIQPDPIAL